jgi:hypothetical protein
MYRTGAVTTTTSSRSSGPPERVVMAKPMDEAAQKDKSKRVDERTDGGARKRRKRGSPTPSPSPSPSLSPSPPPAAVSAALRSKRQGRQPQKEQQLQSSGSSAANKKKRAKKRELERYDVRRIVESKKKGEKRPVATSGLKRTAVLPSSKEPTVANGAAQEHPTSNESKRPFCF